MIKIRVISEPDNSDVKKLIQTVMTEFDCSGPGYSIHDEELDDMYQSYTKPGHIFYVIEDEKILGCGGIGPLQNDLTTCELKKMYFYPELRGKGYGSQLMYKLLAFAKLNYKAVYIETTEQMDQARELYLRHGFKPIEKSMGDTGHFGCDQFYLLRF